VNYSFKAAEDKTAVHVYMPINRTISYRLRYDVFHFISFTVCNK